MEIKRAGSQASTKGPSEWFTGAVRVDPLFQAPEPARVTGGSVTFEPGARTNWHTHPLGQTLVVTAGVGRVQRWGGPVEEIRPGDVVWDSARREALAWCCAKHVHDAHRHSGKAKRKCRGLAGSGQRRAISGIRVSSLPRWSRGRCGFSNPQSNPQFVLSRQRSRVRVSSSPPFISKGKQEEPAETAPTLSESAKRWATRRASPRPTAFYLVPRKRSTISGSIGSTASV